MGKLTQIMDTAANFKGFNGPKVAGHDCVLGSFAQYFPHKGIQAAVINGDFFNDTANGIDSLSDGTDKTTVINDIDKLLFARDSWQGKRFFE